MLGQSITKTQHSGATTKNGGTAEGAKDAEEIGQEMKTKPLPQMSADETG
jgi:hypothetical protein